MANTTPSPNMGMPVPTVSVDPGPDWANNVNASLSIVDSHNHTAGSGVQITPAGLNINTDVPFNNNNATALKSARLQSQSAPLAGALDLGCIYQSGVDLYYNDGDGNQIRMTQSGAPAGATGTITGLPSGTASASYAAGVFSFQSATSTPATMNVGSVVVGQEIASGFGVTLKAANSQAANYDMTLPAALPGSNGYLQLDTSGNLTVQGVVVPGTSDGLVSLNGVPGNTSGSAIAAGYIGEALFGPSNKNTGAVVAFSSSGSWQAFRSIDLTAGVWLLFGNFQIKATDNSTVFTNSASIDFNISSTSASATGVYGSFACMDYNSVFYSNSANNPGYIASGVIQVVLTPSSTTTYYLNANATYTGTAPRGRAGMTAVRIA